MVDSRIELCIFSLFVPKVSKDLIGEDNAALGNMNAGIFVTKDVRNVVEAFTAVVDLLEEKMKKTLNINLGVLSQRYASS